MLKDGKSAGIDNIHAELLKYGPKEISKEIADIYNEIIIIIIIIIIYFFKVG